LAEQAKEVQNINNKEKDRIQEETQKTNIDKDSYSVGYDDGFENGKIALVNELIQTFFEMRDSTTGVEINSIIKILEQRKKCI
jgi:hypothetical protein